MPHLICDYFLSCGQQWGSGFLVLCSYVTISFIFFSLKSNTLAEKKAEESYETSNVQFTLKNLMGARCHGIFWLPPILYTPVHYMLGCSVATPHAQYTAPVKHVPPFSLSVHAQYPKYIAIVYPTSKKCTLRVAWTIIRTLLSLCDSLHMGTLSQNGLKHLHKEGFRYAIYIGVLYQTLHKLLFVCLHPITSITMLRCW